MAEKIVLCSGYVQVAPTYLRQIHVICDRCESRTQSVHYHCLQCNGGNYDLCQDCSDKGIYCRDDTHEWIQRRVQDDEFVQIGIKIHPGKARTMLSSKIYPFRFEPPDAADTPKSLFADDYRFISISDPREILIFTDGACLRNGQSDPQAAACFVYRPSVYSQTGQLTYGGTIALRLEQEGPTGQFYQQTSNRAELRAVIAALMYKDWNNDCNRGWRSIVIATDSEYVVLNATERIARWETQGWKTFDQNAQKLVDIKNQDLWKLLLQAIRNLHADGVSVSFWRIPRKWNERADKYAKHSAAAISGNAKFHTIRWLSPRQSQFVTYEGS